MNNNDEFIREIHQYVTDEASFLRGHLLGLLNGYMKKETKWTIADYVTGKFNAVGCKLEAAYKDGTVESVKMKPYDDKTTALIYIRHTLYDEKVTNNPILKHYLEDLFLTLIEKFENDLPFSDVYLDLIRESVRIAVDGLKLTK